MFSLTSEMYAFLVLNEKTLGINMLQNRQFFEIICPVTFGGYIQHILPISLPEFSIQDLRWRGSKGSKPFRPATRSVYSRLFLGWMTILEDHFMSLPYLLIVEIDSDR